MTHGTTIRDLCQRLDPATQRINERRLVQFGVLEGLIRRLESVSLSFNVNCVGNKLLYGLGDNLYSTPDGP